MHGKEKRVLKIFAMGCAMFLLSTQIYAGPKEESSHDVDGEKVSLEIARERAKTMHEVYLATLDVIHHRYFQRERTIVPARAMEDVFSEIKKTMGADARWMSVNLKAMSFDHEPQTDFEKKASREIAAGKKEVDFVEGSHYRRVASIPLGNGCLGCHEGFFKPPSKGPKFAALVISIPLQDKNSKPK